MTRWGLALTVCVLGLARPAGAQERVPLPTEGGRWDEQLLRARVTKAWIDHEIEKLRQLSERLKAEARWVDLTDEAAVKNYNNRLGAAIAEEAKLRRWRAEIDRWEQRAVADGRGAIPVTPAPVWDETTWRGRGQERREVERALKDVPPAALAILEQRGLLVEYRGLEIIRVIDGKIRFVAAQWVPRGSRHVIVINGKAVREIVDPELNRPPPGRPLRTFRDLQESVAHEVAHGLWHEIIGSKDISKADGKLPPRPGELAVQREWRTQLYQSFDKAWRERPIPYLRPDGMSDADYMHEQFAQGYAIAVFDPDRLRRVSRPIHDWFVQHLPPTYLRKDEEHAAPGPTKRKP